MAETARQRLERRLFMMGVPIESAPIREALDAVYAETSWQPIETAPKGNIAERAAPKVDLWFPGKGRISNCFWLSGAKHWFHIGPFGPPEMLACFGAPTH